MNLAELVSGSLNVTLPVFAMVFIGFGLKRARWVDRAFVDTASQLVFKACMPTLIFLGIIKADLDATLNPALLAYFAVATVIGFLGCWGWAILRVPRPARGVYIQGAFRGNCGIVGLALASAMYGDYGLSTAGLLLGVVILCYNTLSVVVLSTYQDAKRTHWRGILLHIARNPLIIAVVLALPVSLLEITLPTWLMTSGEYFASMTLPLALICIGATLSATGLRDSGNIALGASLMKMITLPALGTAGAWLLGFSGRDLGVLYLFFASPTAAAAFVMAKAMGGDAVLTANIIAITTLASLFTITSGILILQLLGVI
ncbi:AEC family transporter [Halomonas urumqiensis]|uniref:AEC family transporter n=1 Tax=Halomonas urumqiensis TaxID=1684789 RepID=A0A2N7UHN8_9GAMM|nr:AEC family transporter [Halomonas urumqiensis]PMR79923.1 AEC family transporter [Halomonas urumqiensis]PTB02052.1 AEC family transporter [Halomonas urumqiensis]GHE21491.1 malate transporter [Halomonas urumqiensis]